jgi:hypothetical protein
MGLFLSPKGIAMNMSDAPHWLVELEQALDDAGCRPRSTTSFGVAPWSGVPPSSDGVYATRSGTFHSDRDCTALRAGWKRLIDAGGHPGKLQPLTHAQAKQRRLAACQRCASLC